MKFSRTRPNNVMKAVDCTIANIAAGRYGSMQTPRALWSKGVILQKDLEMFVYKRKEDRPEYKEYVDHLYGEGYLIKTIHSGQPAVTFSKQYKRRIRDHILAHDKKARLSLGPQKKTPINVRPLTQE